MGIGPQHEDAVELGVLLGLGAVDGEMAFVGFFEKAAIALVANEPERVNDNETPGMII